MVENEGGGDFAAGCGVLEEAVALVTFVFAAPEAPLLAAVVLAGFVLAAVVVLPLDSAPDFATGCVASSFLPLDAFPAVWPGFGFGRFVEDDIFTPLLLP